MTRPKLKVENRKIVGKKVKKLRTEGMLPSNIYGKNIKSLAVQVSYKDFEKVYKEAGETGLIDVQLNGETKPSLIHNLQQDYYNHRVLHVDFYQVDLKQKVKTTVPLITIGEPKAVSEKIGLLLKPISEVEVEALPEDLPENISVNVESLETVNAQITVGELKAPKGVTILTDSGQVVAKIGELVSKEAAEQAQAEQKAAEEAKTQAAPTGESAQDTGTPTTQPEQSKEAATKETKKPESSTQKNPEQPKSK